MHLSTCKRGPRVATFLDGIRLSGPSGRCPLGRPPLLPCLYGRHYLPNPCLTPSLVLPPIRTKFSAAVHAHTCVRASWSTSHRNRLGIWQARHAAVSSSVGLRIDLVVAGPHSMPRHNCWCLGGWVLPYLYVLLGTRARRVTAEANSARHP